MRRTFIVPFAIALMVAGLLVVFWKPSSPVRVTGKIGRVRIQKVDENETLLILDFNLRNESGIAKAVRKTTASLNAPDGSTVEGHLIAGPDLANVFRNYPQLGEQFNAPLKMMDEFKAGEAVDRSVGIRFDVPDETIARRKEVVLDVEFINGPTVELKAR